MWKYQNRATDLQQYRENFYNSPDGAYDGTKFKEDDSVISTCFRYSCSKEDLVDNIFIFRSMKVAPITL